MNFGVALIIKIDEIFVFINMLFITARTHIGPNKAEGEMDKQELEKIWNEMLKATFDQFITKNIGMIEEGEPPACYKSGDNNPWCIICGYQPTC